MENRSNSYDVFLKTRHVWTIDYVKDFYPELRFGLLNNTPVHNIE